MTKIYIDESGFTGDDLINNEQQFFVIASSLVDDEEAGAILRSCFPRYQGPEFKFTNIWRREAHRNGLRALARAMPGIADRTLLYVVDKRFSLLVKMFDYLVEPGLYAAGRDFYAGGYAMRYLNTIHRDLLAHGAAEIYSESVRLWDAFARRPGAATMAPLRAYLEQVAATASHPVSTIYAMMARGTQHLEMTYPRLEDFADSSEIQVTSILSSITYWRQRRSEDFDLVHDESTSFDKQADLWTTITRDDYAAPPFEQANGSIVELPLRVRSTTAVRSQDSPAIQLCDVLAGFAAKTAVSRPDGGHDPFVLELVGLGAGELNMGGVRPHELYADGPAPMRNGPDMVDRMLGLLEPHLTRITAERAARSDR